MEFIAAKISQFQTLESSLSKETEIGKFLQASATAEAQDATAAGGELQFTPELV
ncbi:hypothetical protein V7121_03730 [Neobacillus drentensis]